MRAWLLIAFLLPTTALASINRAVDILHYDVALVPDIAGKRVTGQMSVTLKPAHEGLTAVVLDSGQLNITSVTHNDRALVFEQHDGRLHITLDQPAPTDAPTALQVLYEGAPPFGLEFAPERDEVYTVFSTSQWMPSVDAPDERATLALSLTLPAGLKAAGTGRALAARTLPDGRVEHRWMLASPMPAYVYGFAAGRYQQATLPYGRSALHLLSVSRSPQQLKQVFARTGHMLDFFADKAGLPYQGDYSQALVARTIGQEMAGLSVMSEAYGAEVLDAPDQIALIAHEAAHQWWGNRVTCASWEHFWLNEGFANFMTAAYLQHAQGEPAYQAKIKAWSERVESLRAKGADRPLVYPDWNAPTADDRAVVYQKGAYVLHLLRVEMGEDAFWRGIRAYTQANDGRSVVTADFQHAMEQAAGRSLQPFFSKWIYP
ncbi:M1 family metallopeptidase [Stenotrophomonas sp. PS02289]|uniref:M1 family metallopeptidase n=1 Tax=Stenotrophomonas sp. PS02289 TaxID=2991422 RepID=UPI00249A14ED|nr:M1 family metallopeptidase [Stenotrophomonas sp. PS02289]